MRPRYIINKGIQKVLKARGRVFTVGSSYAAVIYNPKDLQNKISATATCTAITGDERNQCEFTFSASDTATLKEGYATIEIYDSGLTLMSYKDEFAIIRKNSLQISVE